MVRRMLVETLAFLVILMVFKTHSHRNIFTSNQPEENREIEEVDHISSILSLQSELTLITHSDEDYKNLYVNLFLKFCEVPLIIAQKKENETHLRLDKLRNFAVTTSLKDLSRNINLYAKRGGISFFIVLEESFADLNETWEIFHNTWLNKQTVNVYFLTGSDGILAFDPFLYDFTRSDYGKVMKFADRQSPAELFLNLNGYSLNIEIFKSVYSLPTMGRDGKLTRVTGADALVAYELGRRMNFVILFQEPDINNFGFLTENGTFNGALGRVISNQVDMTITGYFIKDYFTRDIEFTVAVYSDQLCCYVPKADRVPQSILPLFSFSTTMWICYFVTALICGTVWSAMRYFNLVLFNHSNASHKPHPKHFQFVQIFIDTWIVWVRVSLRKFPPFGSEKLFLGSVCLVSVIFGAIFESSLATVYIKPLYYRDITTLRELDASGFEIYYKYASMGDDAFARGSSELFTKLANKMRYMRMKTSTMVTLTEKKNFASITRKSSISLDNVKFFASKQLFLVPECPKTYTLAYVLPIDSPYAERVNQILLQLLNAGFIEKWIDEMYYQAKLEDVKTNTISPVHGAKILTMHDLQLPFIILLSGSIVEFIVLICELCIGRKRFR